MARDYSKSNVINKEKLFRYFNRHRSNLSKQWKLKKTGKFVGCFETFKIVDKDGNTVNELLETKFRDPDGYKPGYVDKFFEDLTGTAYNDR